MITILHITVSLVGIEIVIIILPLL